MASSSQQVKKRSTLMCVNSPIIVGAGPSGLAVAASLCLHSLPSVILERSDTIAPFWHHRTYDRLSLHLPKPFCQLPHLPFPSHFPNYPSKHHFISYLLSYARLFSLRPLFCRTVVDARFDPALAAWRVITIDSANGFGESVELVTKWLVVATGENADPIMPELSGVEAFSKGKKKVVHSAEYKTGEDYRGKKVLVIGCGNSGMEVHILPREMFGKSTFGLAMKLLKWFPVKLVDRLLLMIAKRVLGDTEKYGLKRPKMGPFELKNTMGKTPVLDMGTFSYIKDGRIKIIPEVQSLTSNGAKLIDGREMEFDSVICATGYKSNVPSWLKESDSFSKDGKPVIPFPNGWKGKNGLYWAGFTGKGLLGTGHDAVNIALDIAEKWKSKNGKDDFK